MIFDYIKYNGEVMYYKYDNLKIFYEKTGNGKKNVVILPGWGETKKTFTYMINYLKNDATIYIIDYPGFGNSKFPNYDLTIYDYALMVDAFIRELKIDNPILIGHSFGSRIIILLNSYLANDYDSIIIDGAGIKPRKSIKALLRSYLYKFLKFLIKFNRKNKDKYLEKIRKRFGSIDYNNLPINMRQTFINIVNTNLVKYLKLIKSNVLLIWGENDTDTPLKDGHLMNKLIKNSSLIIIKKAGHFCYLNEPYLVNSIILSFIKEV